MNLIDVSKLVFKEIEVLTHLSQEYDLSGNLKSLRSYLDQTCLLTTNSKRKFVCKFATLNEVDVDVVAQNRIIMHLYAKNDQLVPKLVTNISQSDITLIKSELGSQFQDS